MVKTEIAAWPITLFWFRRDRAYSVEGHAAGDHAHGLAIALDEDIAWFPAGALYVARGTGTHRELAVAHVAGPRGPLLIVELLTPWRRDGHRWERRHAALLSATLRGRDSATSQGASVIDLSPAGLSLLVNTAPAGSFLQVTLSALDCSAVLACEVTAVQPALGGHEVRLHFLDFSAESLVALHTVLARMRDTGGRRAAPLAA
ncbi:MAG: hypothetical protein C0506_05140 [Anaerolinea sp.]|nr:hypothetical protein [Anaerolinea sp.]